MADNRRYDSGTGPQGGGSYNQQNGSGYRYDYGYGGPQYQPPKPPAPRKNNDGWGDWIAMAILFLVPSMLTKIISVIWLVRKLNSMSQGQMNAYKDDVRRAAGQVKDAFTNMGNDLKKTAQARQTQAADAARTRGGQQNRQAQGDAWNVRSKWDTMLSRAQAEANGSKGLMIGGGIMSAFFGLGTVTMLGELASDLFNGYLFGSDLSGFLIMAVFLAGGLGMLLSGIGKRRRADRYVSYLGYIGANREVSLANMAVNFGVPVEKLCKDLRRMLSKGSLPTGYIDLAEGKLFLTEMGYHEAQQEPAQTETPQQAEAREDDVLRQIRQVNDAIPDETMSAKIDRIEEITRKILTYQKEHPDREAQLRSFLNYYLPTTLKILRAYAQLEAQGIEGENISAAKARIEGMMDQVVAGFEKQLDKLFQNDAMDITSDVAVLENMLKKDGLSGDNMTMTL